MLLISSKNIYFSKSYSRFTTVSVISYTFFFLQKSFQKIQNLGFSKFQNFRFSLTFQQKKSKKWFFEKSKFWIFWNVFWKYVFWKSSWVFWPQIFFGCNFSKNQYFYLNPKAYQAACPWLSFSLLDIKNGPLPGR